MALMKSCNYGGCRILVLYGMKHCEKHTQEVRAEHKQDYKNYKVRRTDKREEAFYNSKSWLDVREIGKARTNYMDIYVYYTTGEVVMGETVHHIVCLKDDGGWDHRLDTNNLIYLTYESHAIVHAKYDKNKKDKVAMQMLLFSLLDKFNKEFNN